MASQSDYDYLLKICIIGNTSAGKTSLSVRYTKKHFDGNLFHTIGVEFYPKRVTWKDASVMLQLWDTAGSEQYLSITKSYFRNSHGIIFAYDSTSIESCKGLKYWIDLIQKEEPEVLENGKVIIVGNKCDLAPKESRVSVEEVMNVINQCELNWESIIWREVSAKSGEGVEELFEQVVNQIMENVERTLTDMPQVKNDFVDVRYAEPKKSTGCC